MSGSLENFMPRHDPAPHAWVSSRKECGPEVSRGENFPISMGYALLGYSPRRLEKIQIFPLFRPRLRDSLMAIFTGSLHKALRIEDVG